MERADRPTHRELLESRPGSYRFMVRAINSAGVYSAEPAIVSFKILPPLWRRWWFIALAILLVGAMVFALDRYRVARLRVLDTLNRRLKLEYDIARLLSESSSTLESAPRILQAICEALNWDVGVIWDVDRGTQPVALRGGVAPAGAGSERV